MRRILMAVMVFSLILGMFGCGAASGEWQALSVSRTHMNAAMCFNFYVFSDDAGHMMVTGYCIDEEGKEYTSESGIPLSPNAVTRLRDMNLEHLGAKKKNRLPGFDALDATVLKLELTDAKGRKTSKEIPEDVLQSVFDVILEAFQNQAVTDLQTLHLDVTGMRYHEEYEIKPAASGMEVSLYRDSAGERKLEKCVSVATDTMLEILNESHILLWDGFVGAHPEDVHDGVMFSFHAEVNDGHCIDAEGSENFPDGYREFVGALTRLLSDG